jgi:ABC-type antimicrobial peptide transport system permease subunit
MVQSASRSDTMIETIRKTLLATNSSARIYVVDTMSAYVEQSYWIVRWEASALSMFGGLSLLLAAVGLYGVISYHVTLRTREIGIRVALGAERRDVFRLVIRQGMTLTLIGVALGLVISAMLARLLADFLYGISPTDVITYAATALIWIVVALAACYLPAFRASRVQPMVALRWE